MSREQTKEWAKIGAITENWVKASYPKADAQSAWKYKDRMNRFLEFIGLTDAELIESYKRAKDRVEWAKGIGQKAIAFYNERVSKGYATNTVRAEVSTVRAFCRDNATTLLLPRRKIAKEYGVVVAKDTGAPINLNDLIAVLQKQAQQT